MTSFHWLCPRCKQTCDTDVDSSPDCLDCSAPMIKDERQPWQPNPFAEKGTPLGGRPSEWWKDAG